MFHFLSIPAKPIQSLDRPIDTSLWGTLWFGTWKHDSYLGGTLPIIIFLGHIEAWIFLFLFYIGFVLFLLRSRNRDPWTVFGWMLLGMSTVYLILILYHAYNYPLVQYGNFKSKYIPTALLIIPYAAAFSIMAISEELRGEYVRITFLSIILCAVFLLLCVNYLLPVY